MSSVPEKLLTHKYLLEKINDAMEMNISMLTLIQKRRLEI